MRLLDHTGKRYGKLTALKRIDGCNQTTWLCVCDCGREKNVTAVNLRTGNSKACGSCRGPAKNKKGPGVAGRNALLNRYKNTAKERDLTWGLEPEQFFELTKKNCNYCGHEPSQVCKNNTSVYVFTGVDRIDSSKGYTSDNVVPCCKNCNFAKNVMTTQEFSSWVVRIYTHMFGAKNE